MFLKNSESPNDTVLKDSCPEQFSLKNRIENTEKQTVVRLSVPVRPLNQKKNEFPRKTREERRIRMSVKQTINRFFLGMLLGLVLFGSVGCAVYTNGMTLPNPYYMNNRVQYYPPGNEFPFAKEAANMQTAEADRF